MVSPKSRLKKAYGMQGAFWATHSRAVRAFGKAPKKPIRELFRKAASGTKLSRMQRRQVLETLARLRGNQALVERVSAKTSAKELLSNFMEGLGLKPEAPTLLSDGKIKKLLETTRGQSGIIAVTSEMMGVAPELKRGPFGLILVIDKKTFLQIDERTRELGFKERSTAGKIAATTTTLVAIEPGAGPVKIPLTIMPKEAIFPEISTAEVEEHERSHREDLALGMGKKKIGMPESREEARKHVESQLRMEFSTAVENSSINPLMDFMNTFFLPSNQYVLASMSKKEIKDILEVPDLIEKALGRVPKDELLGLVRTTPLKKLRRRLEGILESAQ